MPELKRILFEEPGKRGGLIDRPFIEPKKPQLGYIAPLEETEAISLDQMVRVIEEEHTPGRPNIFGTTLSRIRCQHGLTQEQLGELVRVKGPLISNHETGIGFPDVDRVMRLGRVLKVSEEELYSGWIEEDNRRASQPIVSDSEVQMSCVKPSVLERVVDESPNPFENAAGQLLKEDIDDVLRTLTQRERRVIQLRFGLDDGREWTLGAISAEFGVGAERIRQIEAKALRKLRHPVRSNKLAGYWYMSSDYNYIDYIDRGGDSSRWFAQQLVALHIPRKTQEAKERSEGVKRTVYYLIRLAESALDSASGSILGFSPTLAIKYLTEAKDMFLGKLPWLVSNLVRQILDDPDYQPAGKSVPEYIESDYARKFPERINLRVGSRDCRGLVIDALVELESVRRLRLQAEELERSRNQDSDADSQDFPRPLVDVEAIIDDYGSETYGSD